MSAIEQVPGMCACGRPHPTWRISHLPEGKRYVCTECAARKHGLGEAISEMAGVMGLSKCFSHFGTHPPTCHGCRISDICRSKTGDGQIMAAAFRQSLTRPGPLETHEMEMAYAAWCRYNRLEPGNWLEDPNLVKWLESGHPKANDALQKLGLKKGGD